MTVQVSKKTKPCKKQYMFCWLPAASFAKNNLLFLFFAAKICLEQKIFVEVRWAPAPKDSCLPWSCGGLRLFDNRRYLTVPVCTSGSRFR